MAYQITSGRTYPMGTHANGDGVNIALFSAHAERVDLCLFSSDGQTEEHRLTLPERTGDIWHGFVPGLQPGTVYGFRVHGPYAPEQGHRFNPNKLLLDPYAKALCGSFLNHDATLGYVKGAPNQDLSFSTVDSAPYVAKAIVADPAFLPPNERRLESAWEETLIYEAHTKGLTQLHHDVPKPLRGTYEGLASDAVVEHLHKLGVTAVELLPVQAFLNDSFLIEKNLTNYWGYNTIGFFTPEPRYFGPEGILGFRSMVRRFHAAGIEVILDVVYNHTAEGDHIGPTLSFRGLDNASYYRLQDGQPRYYVNDTGTGNTVNLSHPNVLQMVLDSLRYWVSCMGVDGFRFDLATALGRENHGFDPYGGFFDALRQDPVLAGVKLIAEPWDIGPGGYQLGAFPPPFAEWNDGYRDTVRRFWKADAHAAQDLGARLLGSAGEFEHDGRRAWSSVNFLAAHDGFTLADVTAYTVRRNEANGEDNQDGHAANHSDNCGVEGATDDPDILQRRAQRQRNMLATLFLSQGTPMLLAGDELGHSQAGNNNAYCQDNEISWIDWEHANRDMIDFVAHMSSFRRSHPALRQNRFLHGNSRPADGAPDVAWLDFAGRVLNWNDPDLAQLSVLYRCSAEAPADIDSDDAVFCIFNRSEDVATVVLPSVADDKVWVRYVDTAVGLQCAVVIDQPTLNVSAQSVLALALAPKSGVL